MSIKDDFFQYIGPEDSLAGYQKSYKMVFLIYFIQMMDEDGKAMVSDVASKFKKFYEERKQKGLLPDVNVEPRIENIEQSTVSQVLSVIKTNPYHVISRRGFMNIETINREEYFSLDANLNAEMNSHDKEELLRVLSMKLNLYYRGIDKNMDTTPKSQQKQEGKNNKYINELEVKKELHYIISYISSQGFTYPSNLLKNFYLSLKSKPFTILAGTSGTGKSKLILLFAESLGATPENGQFTLIPVRPDWSDSSDLLGYHDLHHSFHPGVLTQIIAQAIHNPSVPYFVCLDEMNLARVEYYFSDILSLMETRKRIGEEIQTQIIFRKEVFEQEEIRAKYQNLYIPQNLYIIGTVNMDETTFPFSKKVLDRANTIEFSQVELDVDFTEIEDREEVVPTPVHNDFLKTEYLLIRDCIEYGQVVQDTVSKLKEINGILALYNMHFGYRVRDEVCFYMVYNHRFELLSEEEAFDYQLLQKILPRIQGSMGIKELLRELFMFCCPNYSMENSSGLYEKMKTYCDEHKEEITYVQSAEKIAFMMRRVEQDGFASYWL